LTVDTGQHYDYELNALLYEQLGVRPPRFCLEVGSEAHAAQTAAIMVRAAEIFVRHRPSVVVVIVDTNSTLGCALAAVKLRVPVVHVEAGLRAADALMAEEINRRAVDAVSSVLARQAQRPRGDCGSSAPTPSSSRPGTCRATCSSAASRGWSRSRAPSGGRSGPMSRSSSPRCTARSSSITPDGLARR
jgi:hypothetical protein